MELPFDLAILSLELYPKSPEIPIQKKKCTPMFIAALFTIAKNCIILKGLCRLDFSKHNFCLFRILFFHPLGMLPPIHIGF